MISTFDLNNDGKVDLKDLQKSWSDNKYIWIGAIIGIMLLWMRKKKRYQYVLRKLNAQKRMAYAKKRYSSYRRRWTNYRKPYTYRRRYTRK